MRIQRFTVRSFRNLKEISLEPAAGINWFFGPNGQGKTNILEAIYAALRGKSFRPYSGKADWLPKQTDALISPSVNVHVTDERGYASDFRLTFSGNRQWESYIDEKKVSAAKIRSRVPVVAFSPDDHALVRWEPEIRRHFLDEMLTDVCPGYAESLERHQVALKSRNRLLKTSDRRAVLSASTELNAWSETLAKCAVELCQMRLEMWPGFERYFNEAVKSLFQSEGPSLELIYAPDLKGMPNVENCLRHLMEGLQKDLDTGWTHRGPHRDDFLVSIGGIDSRAGASQGQSRMIALALKWTHAHWVRMERGEVPLFLVDDFSSEFDARRRRTLLEFLSAAKGQVLVTGTDVSLVDSEAFSDYNLYSVCEGAIAGSSEKRFGGEIVNV